MQKKERCIKRQLPTDKKLRNIAYLMLISLSLLFACLTDRWYGWAIFLATAYTFWPAGHYGKRGVQ